MARVLLVEPDRRLAAIYGQALLAAGYDVVTAGSAQKAIAAADQATPDLIILELQLVEHSGIEFLYELRSYPDWQNIPVIIHSQVPPAEFAGSRRLLAEELGVTAYHYKPATALGDLIMAVRLTA